MPVVAPRSYKVCNLHGHDLHARLVPDKDERYEIVIPYPEELEYCDRCQGWHRQRQNQSAKNRKVTRAINECRFE
ncbi:hypothetical protein D3C77_566000 [compost metagenome]